MSVAFGESVPESVGQWIVGNGGIIVAIQQEQRNGLLVYSLGSFKVARNQDVLNSPSQMPNPVWELFKFLLVHRNTAVPLDRIGEQFWNGSSREHSLRSVHSTIHQLDQNLRQPGASPYILLEDGYCSLQTGNDVWLDADELVRLCQEARLKANHGVAVDAVVAYERALALYKGPFLAANVYDDWAMGAQHHYRNVFRQGALECIQLLVEMQDYPEAQRVCRRALAMEPFDEDIHALLLETLAHTGDWTAAQEHYQAINDELWQEFGVRCSPRIETIFQRFQQRMAPKKDLTAKVVALEEIQHDLARREEAFGPFVCDQDTFRILCRLEKRRMVRTKEPVMLGSVQLHSDKHRSGILDGPGLLMEEVLRSCLRTGDVICRWDDEQFLMILPRLQPADSQAVVERIQQRFLQQRPPKGIRVQIRCRTLNGER